MITYSVITVCRNDLNGLMRTCESLRKQVNCSFEWIVVDGKSCDGTFEWLQNLDSFVSIKWISESDGGLYDAMNKGMMRSRGDFLVFLNSGDIFFDSEVLHKVSVEIERSEKLPDFLYGDSVDVTKEGKQFYSQARSFRDLWKGQFAQHQSMFFRREKIGNLQYRQELKLSADYAFIYEFLFGQREFSSEVVRLEFPVCRFLLGGLNIRFRMDALYEDFYVRRRIMNLSVGKCAVLFIFHFAHFVLKKMFPILMYNWRYRHEIA